jgi:hypothetical protein
MFTGDIPVPGEKEKCDSAPFSLPYDPDQSRPIQTKPEQSRPKKSQATRTYSHLFAPIRTLIIFFFIRLWRDQPRLLPGRDRSHPASSGAIRSY